MSNIIRSNQLSGEKRIIQTKKIEKQLTRAAEHVSDPALRKQQLIEELEQLEEQYKQLKLKLKEEQQEAETTIQKWWDEKQQEANQHAEEVAEVASKNGFEAGFEQGMLQAEEDFFAKRTEMQELLEAAYKEKNKIIQSSEAFLLSLSVKIAEKVIKKELNEDNDKLVHMVRIALKHIEESEDVTIQVSPEDYPLILPFIDELQTYVRADSELKLIPASNLAPGGCMIHTASGSYDVTVDSQLDEIKKQLLMFCEEKTSDEHSY